MTTLKDLVEITEFHEVIELHDKNGSQSMSPELWEDFGVMDCKITKMHTTKDEFFDFPILVVEIDGVFNV